MSFTRKNLKTLLPLKKAIGRPAINGWLGQKSFNRTKWRKFGDLALLIDDDEFRAFCSAVGFLEINWAMMESQIDKWIELIFHKLNGSLIQKKSPRAFIHKLKFLRLAVERISKLTPYKVQCLNILDRAEKLSITRNDLTHAVITSIKPNNGVFELNNRKLDVNANHTLKAVLFDARSFPLLSVELLNLGSEAIHLSKRFIDEI